MRQCIFERKRQMESEGHTARYERDAGEDERNNDGREIRENDTRDEETHIYIYMYTYIYIERERETERAREREREREKDRERAKDREREREC